MSDGQCHLSGAYDPTVKSHCLGPQRSLSGRDTYQSIDLAPYIIACRGPDHGSGQQRVHSVALKTLLAQIGQELRRLRPFSGHSHRIERTDAEKEAQSL